MCQLFFLVLLCAACFVKAGPGCNVVTRDEWDAKPSTEVEYMIRPIPYVIIEHTVTAGCSTNAQCIERVAGIQQFHFGIGFSDIGHSFLIGDDGRVYEGRGWLRVGAHARGYNKKSIGIAFIGDFTDKLPKPAALSAAKKLITCGVKNGHLDSTYKLIGHRQVSSTASPGDALYDEIQNWRNWASSP